MIELPEDVKRIIGCLKSHGYAAYAVGGCIRDSLIGRKPNDWDITTEALPEEVKRIFRRTIDTGIAHGTVTVMLHGTGYEVTTYRVDGAYTDARHPESVRFTDRLSEDLLRRDFTINAMAFSGENGLQDLFGGQEDLRRGIVRAVGVPRERFTEDALRIMRCVRFAAQLGFSVDPETERAAAELCGNLRLISRERIREELSKILCSPHPDYVDRLYRIGALSDICPGYEEKREEILEKLRALPDDPILRTAAFFAPFGPERADELMRELRYDNDTRSRAVSLAVWKDRRLSGDPKEMRHAVSEYGEKDFGRFLLFTGQQTQSSVYEGILARGECTSLKGLKISGKELSELGMKPGKEMGELLRRLLSEVLNEPSENDAVLLLRRAAEILENMS